MIQKRLDRLYAHTLGHNLAKDDDAEGGEHKGDDPRGEVLHQDGDGRVDDHIHLNRQIEGGKEGRDQTMRVVHRSRLPALRTGKITFAYFRSVSEPKFPSFKNQFLKKYPN